MNKTIIVTGASRGIGKAIATELAMNNNKIIACYNNSEKETIELKNELKKQGNEIEIVQGDVSNRNDCKKIIEFAISKFNKIDCLINNAGISTYNTFLDITDEEWNRTLNVNLNSVFYMSQEALKYMINEKNGSIINISSICGTLGSSCEVAYSASKAGIIGLTKSLAKELGLSNIRVNAIAPGFIKTDMTKDFNENDINKIIEETPLHKIGSPIDIARCAKWLIEDEFTTGQVIEINGGWAIN